MGYEDRYYSDAKVAGFSKRLAGFQTIWLFHLFSICRLSVNGGDYGMGIYGHNRLNSLIRAPKF